MDTANKKTPGRTAPQKAASKRGSKKSQTETRSSAISVRLAANVTESRDLLVVFSSTGKSKEAGAHVHHSAAAKALTASLTDKSITGKAKEVVLFRDKGFEGHRHLLVVGLGGGSSAEQFRVAGACLIKALGGAKAKSVSVWLEGLSGGKSALNHAVVGLTEGILLGGYKFDELKTKKASEEETSPEILLWTKKASDKTLQNLLIDSVTLAETVNFSRRLGDMPANLMTPTKLADTTVMAAEGTGLKVTVWDREKIEKERMGGLLGVSRGSAEEPRFIIMEYKGAAAKEKPVVFVGKGLTFDSGGISIKPSASMEEMKYDMCGGANVIGAVLAIAKLKLKVNVVGLVAATENMPSGTATKPGDVHTARNGKTFEVNNTDAEGRLVLADALSYGSELHPQVMVDAATLTGAMQVALGNIHTGFYTRNDGLASKVQKAADHSQELVWRMPLVDFHLEDMKGTFADLSNISSGKGAGSATAAAFLEQFVGEGIPWAHFDVAGTAWSVGNRFNYCPSKGASGAMVRTFVEFARLYSKR